MGRVQLEHLESGADGPAGGIREVGDDLLDPVGVERGGLGEVGVGDGRGSDGAPSAVGDGDGASRAGERRRGRRLAAGVTELHAGDGSAGTDGRDDGPPRLGLRIGPEAGILGRDPALG